MKTNERIKLESILLDFNTLKINNDSEIIGDDILIKYFGTNLEQEHIESIIKNEKSITEIASNDLIRYLMPNLSDKRIIPLEEINDLILKNRLDSKKRSLKNSSNAYNQSHSEIKIISRLIEKEICSDSISKILNKCKDIYDIESLLIINNIYNTLKDKKITETDSQNSIEMLYNILKNLPTKEKEKIIKDYIGNKKTKVEPNKTNTYNNLEMSLEEILSQNNQVQYIKSQKIQSPEIIPKKKFSQKIILPHKIRTGIIIGLIGTIIGIYTINSNMPKDIKIDTKDYIHETLTSIDNKNNTSIDNTSIDKNSSNKGNDKNNDKNSRLTKAYKTEIETYTLSLKSNDPYRMIKSHRESIVLVQRLREESFSQKKDLLKQAQEYERRLKEVISYYAKIKQNEYAEELMKINKIAMNYSQTQKALTMQKELEKKIRSEEQRGLFSDIYLR